MAAMNWLFKEEPSNYNFDALVKDKKTTLERRPQPGRPAQPALGETGDQVFYYHTGDEADRRHAKAPRRRVSDPDDEAGKAHVADIGPVKKLARPVTLKEIKADPFFKDFDLVRISRLSVMPVSDAEWARIEKMAGRS